MKKVKWTTVCDPSSFKPGMEYDFEIKVTPRRWWSLKERRLAKALTKMIRWELRW